MMNYINEKDQTITSFEKHKELIASIVSCAIILLAWRMESIDSSFAATLAYLCAYVIGGYAKAKEGILNTIKDKSLNVEILMLLAAIGSAVIGYWMEGAILIFIFALSGALETYALNKNNESISALMKLQPEEAWIVRGGFAPIKVVANTLTKNDHILIKPGERIPADGTIIKGETTIDEAAITGESMPVSKSLEQDVFAGTVNLSGTITVNVTKPNSESVFQKIINLVQTAQSEKSPAQQYIEKFEGTYVKVVLLAVVAMIIAPPFILGWDWTTSFYRAMVLLVVASPCAVVASIMPATLAAIANGARKGTLFKGGAHLTALSNVNIIALDKTGTLTVGTPKVTDFIVAESIANERAVQLLASIEQQSNHPLAKAITMYASEKNVQILQNIQVKDIPGFGLISTIDGIEYRVGKADFVGLELAQNFQNEAINRLTSTGKSVVFLATNNEILAMAGLQDTVRHEAKATIEQLKGLGIEVVMLTGDNEATAKAIAAEANVSSYVANCLPETKVEHIKRYLNEGKQVAMVGDGINDAPALATASVGIAMGDGTDVALETADVVLMKNDLTKLADSVRLAKKARTVITQNILFSLAVITVLIISNFFQVINLPFGVIGHEGSTILVILNGLRLLKN